jgi:hypothetical protein
MDAQWERVKAIIGDSETSTLRDGIDAFYNHLLQALELPCEVTGVEDFRWEEPYVIGGIDPTGYQRLKKTQPSYRDRYELLAIDKDVSSEWMLFWDEDIGAHAKRKSDGKEFWLGLSELKAVEKNSRNAQLIDDFAVYLVNSR